VLDHLIWLLIGSRSHLIRRVLLSGIKRELGSPAAQAERKPLDGDGLLADAAGQLSPSITVHASPEAVLGDIADGVGGAALMLVALLTPFLRPSRCHWGLRADEAKGLFPGDEHVPTPSWSWTHAVEIEAPPELVWPWVVQIGADRGGFYSYQWLENLAGCNLLNAERIHPEWAHKPGGTLVLHPKMPAIPVVSLEVGKSLVAFAAPDAAARAAGRPWSSASWAFVVQPLPAGRCRLISRFRSACSEDLMTRISQGPWLLEPVGFAMDRRMLMGIRARVLVSKAGLSRG
jgi:hypothetical protein